MIRYLMTLPAAAAMAACTPAATPAEQVAANHAAMNHGAPAASLNEAQKAYQAVNDRMHAGMAQIPADADEAFMRGMLAHHQGAVEMSEVALKHGKDAKVRDLANRIIKAQQGEIAEMQAWLKARDKAATTGAAAMNMSAADHAAMGH